MTSKLTKTEFMARYGQIEVTFTSYFKYSFTYEAKLETGELLKVECGGDHDRIYRAEVTPEPVLLGELDPYSGSVHDGSEEIDTFYEF